MCNKAIIKDLVIHHTLRIVRTIESNFVMECGKLLSDMTYFILAFP